MSNAYTDRLDDLSIDDLADELGIGRERTHALVKEALDNCTHGEPDVSAGDVRDMVRDMVRNDVPDLLDEYDAMSG